MDRIEALLQRLSEEERDDLRHDLEQDGVLRYMVENDVPLTQSNYMQLAHLGDGTTIEDYDAELLSAPAYVLRLAGR